MSGEFDAKEAGGLANELVEQCRDYLAHEAMDSGDPSGKLHDFVGSLQTVLSALSSTREKYEQAVREVEEVKAAWDRGVGELTKASYAQVSLVTNRLHETEAELYAARALANIKEACRESAEREVEALTKERDYAMDALGRADQATLSALRERDELRVEVEKLRASAENWDPDAYLERTEHLLTERDELRAENSRLMEVIANDMRDIERMKPVYEASLAMRRSESRVALSSDVIAEIESERALTEAQVEARSQAALTRWRTVVDAALTTTTERK